MRKGHIPKRERIRVEQSKSDRIKASYTFTTMVGGLFPDSSCVFLRFEVSYTSVCFLDQNGNYLIRTTERILTVSLFASFLFIPLIIILLPYLPRKEFSPREFFVNIIEIPYFEELYVNYSRSLFCTNT